MAHNGQISAAVIADGRRRAARRPWLALLNQVLALADGMGELVRHAEKPWASVMFSGSRHTVELAFNGLEGIEMAEHLIAALPDHEFTIPGQIVADATVTGTDQAMLPEPRLVVEMEFLLLEDR